ncbi:MAG: ABC transporter ATP-binding protein [Candidatus Bruticola sp.]
MDDSVVEFRDVTRQYGSVTAVNRMNLSIHRGEFFSLLGPSGCGKTTTLRMIAGFDEPDNGEVFINGQEVTHLPPFQRQVNTVFQNYALFPHLNVYENIAFGLRRKKASESEISRKVKWALELVQLEGTEKRQINQLSGGQQQRIALARALVNEPEVLLLDEPLAALDQKLRREMQFELKRLQRELGITFVLVTHDQEEALTMSDSVAVICKGKLEQVGSPAEIYNHPSTRFVADFIGTANFLPVQIRQVHNGKTTVCLTGKDILVPSRKGLTEGCWADLSIRPERVQVLKESASEGVSIPGTVVDTVFMGAHTRINVRVGDKYTIMAERQNQNHTYSTEFTPGESVWLNWGIASATLLPQSNNN